MTRHGRSPPPPPAIPTKALAMFESLLRFRGPNSTPPRARASRPPPSRRYGGRQALLQRLPQDVDVAGDGDVERPRSGAPRHPSRRSRWRRFSMPIRKSLRLERTTHWRRRDWRRTPPPGIAGQVDDQRASLLRSTRRDTAASFGPIVRTGTARKNRSRGGRTGEEGRGVDRAGEQDQGEGAKARVGRHRSLPHRAAAWTHRSAPRSWPHPSRHPPRRPRRCGWNPGCCAGRARAARLLLGQGDGLGLGRGEREGGRLRRHDIRPALVLTICPTASTRTSVSRVSRIARCPRCSSDDVDMVVGSG